MTRRIFSIAICLVMLFGTFFHVGGPQSGFVGQALAEAANLDDIAGISAYTKVSIVPLDTTFLADAQLACNGEPEILDTDYFVCSVPIDGYAEVYAPHVFVSNDGYIMAYYLKDEPAAKMLDVIAQPLDTGLAYPTLLEQAIHKVFSASLSEDLIYVVENTSLLGSLEQLTATFSASIPQSIVDAPYKINSKMTLGDPVTEGTTVTIEITVDGIGPFPYVTEVPVPGTEFWVTDLIPGSVAADFDVNYSGREEIYNITLNGNYVSTDVTIQSIISLDGFATEVVLAEIMLPVVGDEQPITTSTSLLASETVETVPYEIYYYDFSQPGATNILMVAEDKAEDLGELGDDDAWMTLTLPEGTFYEISYAFYQNYYPIFSLNNTNFVTSDADYVGPVTLGSIYGILDETLHLGESYLFEVDTFSLADAGYGALLFTYSGATGDFTIVSSDWVQPFTLVAPPEELTGKFTFDFAPGAFAKIGPLDDTTGVGTSVTLSWALSTGASSYEYCIDEIDNSMCDTGWVSTGENTSVELLGLPYNATYYWQVRAVNSYTTTEADGSWWSFSTIAGPPANFYKLTPTDSAEGVATSPLLDWADTEGAEYYEYSIDNGSSWINTGLVSQAVVSLLSNIQYTWQVRACNIAGCTDADGSDFWTFTTIIEGFSKTSPVDGATNVNPRVTLSWETMDGATGYEYCVDTTDDDHCTRWTSVADATSVTMKGLKYGTTYFWQIRAVTPSGTVEADSGDWWTFTTRARSGGGKP